MSEMLHFIKPETMRGMWSYLFIFLHWMQRVLLFGGVFQHRRTSSSPKLFFKGRLKGETTENKMNDEIYCRFRDSVYRDLDIVTGVYTINGYVNISEDKKYNILQKQKRYWLRFDKNIKKEFRDRVIKDILDKYNFYGVWRTTRELQIDFFDESELLAIEQEEARREEEFLKEDHEDSPLADTTVECTEEEWTTITKTTQKKGKTSSRRRGLRGSRA